MQKSNKPASLGFALAVRSFLRYWSGLCVVLICAVISAIPAQAATSVLGTTNLVEGPGLGSDSVVLAVNPQAAGWSASANSSWLHLTPANQSGTGSTNVIFSFDANSGTTRAGTLTVAGLTLTVMQCGSNYVTAPGAEGGVTQLGPTLIQPTGVAADVMGNVYIADYGNNTILRWTKTNNSDSLLPLSIALENPAAVALDTNGNVYIADAGSNAVYEWTSNQTLITLVSNGLSTPSGLAVDLAGNVYIADTYNSAVKEWVAATSNVTTLLIPGLGYPFGLAVDAAGNLYIADIGNNAVEKWTAATSSMTPLVSTVSLPFGVAVDGSGNVYVADSGDNAIKKWIAASNHVVTLASLGQDPIVENPQGVAVDGAGNVYMANYGSTTIAELPHAFVNTNSISESAAARNDVLPVVLPPTENLLVPFAPVTNASWLSINGITNDVVSFGCTANAGPSRLAYITVFGQNIPITQLFPSPMLYQPRISNGVWQVDFSNNTGASFTVLSTTNLSLPLNKWTVAGSPTNIGPNLLQFSWLPTTNDPHRFFLFRSP
jgi:sugar lactone lactonase YvrE